MKNHVWLIALLTIAYLMPVTGQDDNIGQIQQGLVAQGNSIWPQPTCEVCWENPSAGNQTERDWVRAAVQRTWESECGFSFTGWGTCQSGSRGVRIRIEDTGPHVKKLGRHLDGMKDGMVLNFTFQNWSQNSRQRRQFAIEAIAVHEFGHALGFAHEHNTCTFDGCRDAPQGTNGDYKITVCDLHSVMNYCNPAWNGNGELSRLDILGAVALYGPPASNTNAFSAVMEGDRIHVFKRHTDGTLHTKQWDGRAWTQWVSTGPGAISSGPSAIIADGRVVVFARTMHGTLTHKYYDARTSRWSDWVHLGDGLISSAPAAVYADGRPVVFARTMHGTLTHKFYDRAANTWTDWIHLGNGEISSSPAAIVADGRLTVFARTMHGTLTHKFYDDRAGSWTGWVHLGDGVIGSSPASVMAGNRLTVFARTMHGTLTHKFYDPAARGWTDWVHLGQGELSAAPSAVMAGNRLTVFSRTLHKTLTHKFYDPAARGWTDWVHLE